MSCQTFREKLIDLVYDELPADERPAVEQHLAGCPGCRAELEALRFARGALADALADEPPAALRLPSVPVRGPRTIRWLPAFAAAAAAVLIAVGVWVFHDSGTVPVFAESGPPVIEKRGVSLTILSRPEGWAAAPSMSADSQQSQVQQMDVQIEEPVQTAVNVQGGWQGGQPLWQGMALVRDQRLVRRMPAGVTKVRFADVPSGILPDTVRLRSLDRPDGLAVLEQNYQYDLASAAAVLQRYVDRPVTAVFKDDKTVAGTLLSFDDRTLVLQPAGEGPRNVSRGDLRGVAFGTLPDGLLTRPTLVWSLANRAASQQQFEVAYLTHGLQWRADYILKLHPAQPIRNLPAGRQVLNPVDTADLIGYATVNNFSGVTYRDAQLKLMAGDVNLIKPPVMTTSYTVLAFFDNNAAAGLAPVMTEKSFFEYHLYTVTRPTTLRDAETKQLEMVSGSGLKLQRGYVYDPQENATAARVVSELKNTEANGLGKPLPKGVVRLYAPDPEGVDTYVSQTRIEHTPKGEKLRFAWGHAFDIACSAKRTDSRHSGDEHEETWQYQVRNHKDSAVRVTIVVHVPPSTYRAACECFDWHVRQVGVVEIEVPAPPGEAVTVPFTYRWNPHSGGGLTGPRKADGR